MSLPPALADEGAGNFFDQFDAPAEENFFDQYDAKPAPQPSLMDRLVVPYKPVENYTGPYAGYVNTPAAVQAEAAVNPPVANHGAYGAYAPDVPGPEGIYVPSLGRRVLVDREKMAELEAEHPATMRVRRALQSPFEEGPVGPDLSKPLTGNEAIDRPAKAILGPPLTALDVAGRLGTSVARGVGAIAGAAHDALGGDPTWGAKLERDIGQLGEIGMVLSGAATPGVRARPGAPPEPPAAGGRGAPALPPPSAPGGSPLALPAPEGSAAAPRPATPTAAPAAPPAPVAEPVPAGAPRIPRTRIQIQREEGIGPAPAGAIARQELEAWNAWLAQNHPASAPSGLPPEDVAGAPPSPAAPQPGVSSPRTAGPSAQEAGAAPPTATAVAEPPQVAPPPMPPVPQTLAEIQTQRGVSSIEARRIRAEQESAYANWHFDNVPGTTEVAFPPEGPPLRDGAVMRQEMEQALRGGDQNAAQPPIAPTNQPLGPVTALGFEPTLPAYPVSGPTPVPPEPPAPPPPPPGSRAAPVILSTPTDIHNAAAQVGEPTDAQKQAGNYAKGHITIGGLPVTIENPAGSERSGVSPDGTRWTSTLGADYGYIKRTKGADGDQVDVFLGPQAHEAAKHPVWVIDQITTDGGRKFDEHKAMIGFPSLEAARAAYLASFSDNVGTDRIGAVTEMAWPQFKRWARSGDTNKPLAYKAPKVQTPKRERAPKGPLSLLQFLAAKGGLAPDGDLRAMDAHKRVVFGVGGPKSLVRRQGLALDYAREAAEEAGYLRPGSDISDLLNAITDELKGRKVFSEHEAGDAEVARQEERGAVEEGRRAAAEAALNVVNLIHGVTMSPEEMADATRLVMQGMDPEDAMAEVVERAAIQAVNDAVADAPRDSGFDIPFELEDRANDAAGQAGDAGQGAEAAGREAARAEPGQAGGHEPGRGQRDGSGADQGQPAAGDTGAGAAEGGERAGSGLATELVDTLDGKREQTLIPGVAPVTDRERMQAKADAPKRGGDAPPGGMFGPVGQADLVDHTRSTLYGSVAAPNEEALTEAFRKRIAERGDFPSQQQAMRYAGQLLGAPVLPGSRAAATVESALDAARRYRTPAQQSATDAYNEAFAEHERARTEHMAGRMSDKDYVAVRQRFEAAKKAANDADTNPDIRAEAGWGVMETASDQRTPPAEVLLAVAEAVKAITGGHAEIKFVEDTFPAPSSGGAKSARGLAFGPLIIAALSPYTPWVLHHEAVHVLRNLGVLGPKEWATLRGAAEKQGWLKEFDILARYAHLTAEGQMEEAIADKFGQWSTRGTPQPQGAVGRVWGRTKRFVGWLGNALKGNGFQTAEDVFERMASGEVGRRAPGSQDKQRGPQTVGDAVAALALFSTMESVQASDLAGMLKEIRASLPPRQGQMPLQQPVTFNSPPESRLDNVLRRFQDRMIDTKRVQQEIEKIAGPLPDAQNIHERETLYHGRVAKRVKDFVVDELRPLLEDMQRRDISRDDLGKFLWARRAEEYNRRVAAIDPNRPDGGSGMMTADARAILAGYTPDQLRDLSALAQQVDSITRGTRRTLVQGEIESQATIDQWEAQSPFYVPLNRADVDNILEQPRARVGQGFSQRGPFGKRAMGSEKEVVNILGNIALQRERAVVRVEKNRVAQSLIELARDNPNPGFWKVNERKLERYFDQSSQQVKVRIDPNYKSDPNVIVARSAGRGGNSAGQIIEETLEFNAHDPRAARMVMALKNMDMDDIPEWLSVPARVTRFIAAMNTQFNPFFGIRNIQRDLQEGMINLASTPLAGKQLQVASHVPSALRGIYGDLRARSRGATTTTQWAHLWEQFQNDGGQTGFREMYASGEERAKEIEREVKRLTAGAPGRAWQYVKALVSDYNEALENAVRLAAYKTALDNGMSRQKAAILAKDLTLNFNRKGSDPWTRSLYAFFNARVQGVARMVQTITQAKNGKWIVGGMFALGVAQALMLNWRGIDTNEIAPFTKDRNTVIPSPFSREGYFTIPAAQGTAPIVTLGRLATEAVIDPKAEVSDKVMDMLGAVLGWGSPIGGTSLAIQTAMPTPIQPLVAVAENKNFDGRPIARQEQDNLNPKPGYLRGQDSAMPPSRWLSYGLNRATGGTDFKPGKIDIDPNYIDFLAGQFLGGPGREVMRGYKATQGALGNTEFNVSDVPGVNIFYGETDSPKAIRAQYFENVKWINQEGSEVKGRAKSGQDVAGYVRANPGSTLFQSAVHEISTIRKMQQQVREMRRRGDPVERIRAIENDTLKRMRAFNARVLSIRNQPR